MEGSAAVKHPSGMPERSRLDAKRAAAAFRAEKLLEITAAVADADSISQVFDAVVQLVREGVQASSAGLWLLDEIARTVRLVSGVGYTDGAREQLAALSVDAHARLPVLDALKSRAAVWIPSQAQLFERYPHLRGVASEGRSYRIACLPLLAEQQVVGVLGVTIEQPGEAAEEERDFLLLAARYASQAILRFRLLEAERQSRAEASAAAERLLLLGRVSRVFSETDLALAGRLRGVASELSSVLGSCINIALLKDDGGLDLAAVHHPDPTAHARLSALAASRPLRAGEGVTGQIALTGESALIAAIDPEMIAARAAPGYRDFLRDYPAYAFMGAPLRVRGRPIGVVTATRVHAGESYGTEDLRLLEELAERAAVSIENSRLYEQAIDARVRTEQLYLFARAVVDADRLESVFEAALVALEHAVGTPRSAILRMDPHGRMRFSRWRGLSDEYRSAVEGHNPWRSDDLAPAPVLVPDARADASLAAYRSLFARERIGALAFIPLVARGRLLGKFMLYYEAPNAFSAADIETASTLSNHLASVILRFETVAALQETVRNNELLAGVLAHDLRTPLAAIMTAAHLLLDSAGDEGAPLRDATAAGKILTSGARMKAMIEQLLDFTRARSGGGIGIDPKPTNLAQLCTQALDELELTNPAWRLEARFTGDPAGCWDADRMLQVVSNLTANAGQHGRAGGVITVRVDGTDPAQVALEVHNEGAIVCAEPRELFDPFRSVAQAHRGSSGLGLGLFIVREIVMAHGGSVDVVTSEEGGTTFVVKLPRVCAAR